MKYKANDILIQYVTNKRVLITYARFNGYGAKWWRADGDGWGSEVSHSHHWLESTCTPSEATIIDRVLNKYL